MLGAVDLNVFADAIAAMSGLVDRLETRPAVLQGSFGQHPTPHGFDAQAQARWSIGSLTAGARMNARIVASASGISTSRSRTRARIRSAVTIRNAAGSLMELDAIGIRPLSFSTDRNCSATKRWPLANSTHLRSFLPAVKPPISASATSCIGVMSRANRIAASSVDC